MRRHGAVAVADIGRGLTAAVGALTLTLVVAAPAHAVATVAADTTRSLLRNPQTAGRSADLVAGGLDRTLLRFSVRGLGGSAKRASLRLRVIDATVENLAVRVISPRFGEDDGTPLLLAAGRTSIANVSGARAGTWAEWDVTGAVAGDGEFGFQVSGPLLDPARFSSREGPDAPQLVVTPDDARGARLAGLLDPRFADAFVVRARDDLGRSLDALDVIAAPPAQGVPGRYVGVHHTFLDGRFVTQLATSDDLTTWTHRADLEAHASQPTLAALPDGGFVLAFERDTPDAEYISRSHIVVRHYAGWAALAAGAFDRQAELARTLAPTAEGTPALTVNSWNGPDDSQIAISFHYLEDIDVDRQAAGVLTNFDAVSWAPQRDTVANGLFAGLGTRGNLGDRAELLFDGQRFQVVEAQSIKADFSTWRWYLYDRQRNEARLLALRTRAGSYAMGNPTVRLLSGPAGQPLLFFSGYAFSQGADPGEAGQFIALRVVAEPRDPARRRSHRAPPPSTSTSTYLQGSTTPRRGNHLRAALMDRVAGSARDQALSRSAGDRPKQPLTPDLPVRRTRRGGEQAAPGASPTMTARSRRARAIAGRGPASASHDSWSTTLSGVSKSQSIEVTASDGSAGTKTSPITSRSLGLRLPATR